MEAFVTTKKYVYFLTGILVFFGLYLTSHYSYLLFHSLAEIFSIVVACGIFIVAWNSRRFLDNNYLLFIGIAYLFVGGLDLIHTLAYKGMGVFQGYETNLATQLWIATRYVQSLSLFIAPFFFPRKLKINLVFLGYTVVVSLLLMSIFYWNIFPVCFIEGVGLTSFKKISEYIISLILLASIFLLLKNRREFEREVLQWVVWSIIVTIVSELAFTFYIDAYGFSNLIGHFFEILAFYFIYKAIIETGLRRPYDLLFRDLKQKEQALAQLASFPELNPNPVVEVDLTGHVSYLNSAAKHLFPDLQTTGLQHRWLTDLEALADIFERQRKSSHLRELKIGEVWYEQTIHYVFESKRLRIYGLDVTERKRAEERIKESEKKYRELYEGSQDGFVHVDMEGHIKEFNRAYIEMLGYSKDELMKLTYVDLTPKKWHSMEAKIVEEQVLTKGYSKVYEKEYIKKDGTIFPVSLRTYFIKDKNGNPLGMWAFVRDITKRKEMEEALRRSHGELEIRVQERTLELTKANEELQIEITERKRVEKTLIEQSRILDAFFTSTITPLVFLDRNFNFVRVNEAYAKACQRDISEFDGHNHFEFYPHEENEAIFRKVVETKFPYQAIARPFAFPDHPEWGITYWNWTLTPVLDNRGEAEFLVFSLEDVTERKRAEEALQESENRLRHLSSQLLTVQEKERKRIANELHDGIGQMLTAIKFKVENTLQQKERDKTRAKEKSLEAIIPMIQESIEEVRRIQMDLRPSTLDDLGILATLEWFCREYQKIYSHIRIEKEIGLQESEVSTPLKTVIYRVMQEAMNNIAKHSKADLLHLSLKKKDDRIELVVEDNGTGFDLEKSKKGFGLGSMRERTELSGGIFTIESTPGKGTMIRIIWPIS